MFDGEVFGTSKDFDSRDCRRNPDETGKAVVTKRDFLPQTILHWRFSPPGNINYQSTFVHYSFISV